MVNLRKFAIGLGAALLPMVVLSGCAAGSSESSLERELADIDGVNGAWVRTTTSGSPTNRGLAIRLYLDESPGEQVARIADEAAETAWNHDRFEPTNGLHLEMEVGARPREEPRPIDIAGLVDLRREAREAGVDLDGEFGSRGSMLIVPAPKLEERFGVWGS